MYICMHVHLCAWTFVCMYLCVHVHLCASTFVGMPVEATPQALLFFLTYHLHYFVTTCLFVCVYLCVLVHACALECTCNSTFAEVREQLVGISPFTVWTSVIGLRSSGVEAGPIIFCFIIIINHYSHYYSDTGLLIVLGKAKLGRITDKWAQRVNLLCFPSDGITSKMPSCPTF